MTTTWIPTDTFGVRLAAVRAARGLNVKQAAEACGLSDESWRQWEHGTNPRALDNVARKIEEALGVDRSWLLAGGPLATPVIQRYTGVAA